MTRPTGPTTRSLDDTFLMSVPPRAGTTDRFELPVAAFEPRSLVAGPGERAVVWVPGCNRRCPGCMTPQFWSFDAGSRIDVRRLALEILDVESLTGLTLSGGEPFEHVAPLAQLARIVHAAGLDVLCYSGYRIEALRADPSRFSELLDELDYLIDGEYRQECPGPIGWRGSSNQRLHRLTARAQAPEPQAPGRHIQLSVHGRGIVRSSGFPDRGFEQSLEKLIAHQPEVQGVAGE